MPQQHKLRDELAMMNDAVVLAAGTTGAIANHDSTAFDLGAADVDEARTAEILFDVTTDMTSGGSATVALTLLDCDTVGGTYAALTPTGVSVPATAFDNAIFLNGAEPIRMPIPKYGVRQFVKLRYAIATATVTAGVIDTWLAKP